MKENIIAFVVACLIGVVSINPIILDHDTDPYIIASQYNEQVFGRNRVDELTSRKDHYKKLMQMQNSYRSRLYFFKYKDSFSLD